ncbi:MAG: hypothetical protein IPM42_02330 [Saprospiraceae bacterium]|nr:hypothetical protein [Saprospiraceae bacterium]
MRENKNFDDILRSKLNELSAQNTPGDWSSFEHLLDAENDFQDLENDMEFDAKVQESVEYYAVPYSSGHWNYMKEVLETLLKRKLKIYTVKSFEFCAVLLILFTIYNLSELRQNRIPENKPLLLAYDSGEYTSENAFSDTDKRIQSGTEKPDFKHGKLNQTIVNRTKNHIAISSREEILTKAQPENLSQEQIVQVNQSQVIDSNTIAHFDFAEFENEIAMDSKIILNNSDQEVESFQDVRSKLLDISSLNKDFYTLKLASIFDHQISADSIIACLLNRQISMAEEDPVLLQLEPLGHNEDFVRSSFGIYYSADVNLINTPFDKVYSVASYNKEAFNNSYGFNLSFRKNYWSWDAGLKYTTLKYRPQLIKEQHNQIADNFFETSLDEIAYNILSLPAGIKLHMVKNKSWDAYLSLGSTLNLITDAEYEITTKIKQGRNASRSLDTDLRLIDEKKFTPGYFENGSFKDNYFVTAGFGFGIEKTLYQRSSLYLQSQYNRHLISADIGIGPNKDKIHTLSLQIGARVILN